MALIIEDGTGKTDAESFATAAELVAYGAKYGVTVPDDEPSQEAALRRSAVQMLAMSWKGCKTSAAQSMPWPRYGAEVDGEIIPSNYIPARIQYGQMALACEIHADDLDPPEQRKGAVVRERVEGAVDVEYAQITNKGSLLPAAPDRPSGAQFADYLAKRGLFAVRA